MLPSVGLGVGLRECSGVRLLLGCGRELLEPVLLAQPHPPVPVRAAAALRAMVECRGLDFNLLQGTIPTEMGLMTKISSL